MSEHLIELQLKNSEGENVIAFVTAKDAERVVNDPYYAQLVANTVLGRVTQIPPETCISQSQVARSDITSNEEEEEEEINELDSTKESGAKWNSAATLLLLHEYSEKESLFKSGKKAHKFYWEEIAKVMRSKGYTFSWGQVSSKMDSLKRRYKKIKDAAKQSGNGRIPNWEFYESWKRFSDNALGVPLSTASSSGLSDNIDPDFSSLSETASDKASYTSENDKKKKTRGEQLVDAVYSKVKRDRDERHLEKLELHKLSEEKKEVRHKEKMAMKAQFLQVLKASLKVTDTVAQGTMDCDAENSQ